MKGVDVSYNEQNNAENDEDFDDDSMFENIIVARAKTQHLGTSQYNCYPQGE